MEGWPAKHTAKPVPITTVVTPSPRFANSALIAIRDSSEPMGKSPGLDMSPARCVKLTTLSVSHSHEANWRFERL